MSLCLGMQLQTKQKLAMKMYRFVFVVIPIYAAVVFWHAPVLAARSSCGQGTGKHAKESTRGEGEGKVDDNSADST